MMNNRNEINILDHLTDLRDQSERQYRHVESMFLNEEEQAQAQTKFPESNLIHYEGGYEGARKKKVIFLRDEEDDFSDIVCIEADTDQRFRKIGHRDVLGSIMSLGVDRHALGDFWLEEGKIYIYTTSTMGKFLVDNLLRISALNVSFHLTDDRPIQKRQIRQFEGVIASERLDAIVASLAHTSRSNAKQMIVSGHVQVNHVTLVNGDKTCHNNSTISIRGYGRFRYLGIKSHTRKDRIVAEFEQDM